MEGTVTIPQGARHEQSWRDFKPGDWCSSIEIRDFVARNVVPYTGDESFLAGPTKRTSAVWEVLQPYF